MEKKTAKAILIDAQNETIIELTLNDNNTFMQLYKSIGFNCQYVEPIRLETLLRCNNFSEQNYVMWMVDFTKQTFGFTFNGTKINGNAIIIKCNENDDWVSPDITIEQIRELVKFSAFRKYVVAYIAKEKCKEIGSDITKCKIKEEENGGVSIKYKKNAYLFVSEEEIEQLSEIFKGHKNFNLEELIEYVTAA